MPASVLTLFLNNPIRGEANAGTLDLTQPAASTSTTGWTVGTTVAARFSRMTYNVEVPAANFTATAQPSAAPTNIAEDCWRLSAVTTGTFSAGTWYSAASIIAVTNASSQAGRARFRIWRGQSPDGVGVTELTRGTMVGSTTAALSTTVAASSSASTQIASSAVTNEYLFLEMAWETTTAGTNANADALIRLGPVTSNVAGSFLATSAFSSITPAAAGGGGFYERRRSIDGLTNMDDI